MIPGDLLSAFPHRQFHTLPGLLDSWAALPNSNPNACVPMQGSSLYRFYDGLRYDPAERGATELLHSQAALPNSYPYACMPSFCSIFMIVFGMTGLRQKQMTLIVKLVSGDTNAKLLVIIVHDSNLDYELKYLHC